MSAGTPGVGARLEPLWGWFRGVPWWLQTLAWLLGWPVVAAVFLARWRRLGPAALPVGVSVLLVGGLAWAAAFASPPATQTEDRGGERVAGTSVPGPSREPGDEDSSSLSLDDEPPASNGASEDGPEGSAESTPAPAPARAADPSGELEIHFIDVGQGDATLLVAPDATVLIDAGRHDRSDVVPYLRSQNVGTLDVVIVTHPHADHLGQFDEVVDAFTVDEVWWSGATHTTQTFERAVDALERSGAAYEEPRAGDSAAVGSLLFEFVNPPSGLALGDLHDSSLAFRVTYGDVRLLFTGDAETATEARMVSTSGSELQADIYQVGHHGSGTSTSLAFLTAVSPSLAVYSAGSGNSYGHPAREVIDRLSAAGIELHGTDRDGTVTITTDGNTWRVGTAADDSSDLAADESAGPAPAATTPPTTALPPPPPPAPPSPEPEPVTQLSVTFTGVTSPVKAGANATAAVVTGAGANCSITVTYKSGPSKAKGLDPKFASGDGAASWTWKVGSRTTPGDWPIDVTCQLGGASASERALFTVQ